MKKWAIVLHLYQPPTQDWSIVQEVLRSCYLPLFTTICNSENARFTVNFSGGLLQQLHAWGERNFLSLVKNCIKSGKIELLNSPIYHSLIPLTPVEILERQLRKNSVCLRKTLGKGPGQGVYPPELAVDEKSIEFLKDWGKYVVVDETAVGKMGIFEFDGVKLVAGNRRLCEVIRSYPDKLSVAEVYGLLDDTDGEEVISVYDAEVFGHHYEERLGLLSDLINGGKVKFVTVSDLIKQTKAEKIKTVFPSNWQVKEGLSMWNGNELQKMYLRLGKFASLLWEEHKDSITGSVYNSAADHLDQGWSSCHLYWLSNDPWWHPDLVGKGAENLIRCIRSLPGLRDEKMAAESLYHAFLEKMWKYHWSGKVEEGYRIHDLFFRRMVSRFIKPRNFPI